MQLKLGNLEQKLKHEKQVLLQIISLILAVFAGIAITARLALGLYRSPVVWMLFFTICVLLFCFQYVKNEKYTDTVGIIIILLWVSVLDVIGYMNGGVGFPSLVMMPLIPLVAILIIGPRACVLTLALIVISIGLFMYLHGIEHDFPVSLLSHDVDIVVRSILIILTAVLITWIGWHYSARNHHLIRFAWSHASHDYLTGLVNRRLIDETLQNEIDRARRNHRWLSCIIVDIDHFKEINDSYGHQAGDETLINIANLLDSSVKRAGDVVGRYGGEEFLIILPETDQIKAMDIAEKIRSKVANAVIMLTDGHNIHVTLTLGVTSVNAQTQTTSSQMIHAADSALYEGKASGRNTVVYANPDDEP